MARSGGPLEPPSGGRLGGRVGVALATARDVLQYRSVYDPTDVLAGVLLGTGWLVVTVGGIHLGVRHHEFRAETPRENPNPARWWPPPRHG
jgi:hypothetical protein